MDPAALHWGSLPENTQIGEVKPVFPRLDKAKIMTQISKANEPSTSDTTEGAAVTITPARTETPLSPPAPVAPDADAVEGVTNFIEIGDFAKVDLRVGQVLTAERIPKADKLLLLSIDIGEEKPRQILAGIAEYYQPEQMLNRKVVVVANLKPRKLRGHESQGMVVAASIGPEGRPVIATFTEDVPNGARLK
jgi:methionyl-tRNA synthetase